jgi:hypothetical protein
VITGIAGDASLILGFSGFCGIGSGFDQAAENNTAAEAKQMSIKIVLSELFLPIITHGY